jgi:hypothetical protein
MAHILSPRPCCDDDGVQPDPATSGAPVPDPAMPDMPSDPVRTRGRYRYVRDGEPVGVDERFVLGDVAPGAVRVRSTRVSATPVSRLEVDARLTAAGSDVQVRWTGSAPDVARSASAAVTEREGRVATVRTVDGTAYDDAPVVGALYPLMRVFTGLRVLASLAGPHAVVVPDIAAAADAARFLSPVVSERSAEALGERGVVVGGVEHPGTAYRWVGGAYPDGAEFVVDPGGLLLEYAVAQDSGRWVVSLAEVTGPWPEPLSWPSISAT